MAQRRIFRSLATTTRLQRLTIHLAHAKKARSVPVRAGDAPADAAKAMISTPVPQKAIIHDVDVVGSTLPFTHQNCSAARKRSGQSRRRLGSIASEHPVKQPSQLLGDRFAETTLTAFLTRIGDAERKDVSTKRSRRLLAKLLSPDRAQLASQYPIKIVD